MVKLQDDVLSKQQAKALAMRQRFEERTKRFLDAKQRTIGVDKAYLHKQVEEKNIEISKQKEDSKKDAEDLERLCKYLEEREIAQRQVKQKELDELYVTLEQQSKQPKNNAIDKGDPLNLESCGPSSIQRFQGEDQQYNSRKRLQQQQLQMWSAKQHKEIQERQRREQEKEIEYSQYVVSEDKIRCEIYEQEQNDRKKSEKDIMKENLKLAEDRRMRRRKETEKEKELEANEANFLETSPLFTEETDFAQSDLSEVRARPDHFKGFSPAKNKAIFDENASVFHEKQMLMKAEKEMENEWALQQTEMLEKMEELDVARKQSIAQDNQILAEAIRIQREELKEKQLKMTSDRFGSIGVGFFQKFGTSCR